MKKFILLFILLSGSLLADDLVVDGTGIVPNSYLTITEALSAASEGDNILVSPSMPGGYINENLVIDKSVSIFSLTEGEYFFMEGNIMINLDNVLEFSLIGGVIYSKIESNLVDQQRSNNSVINIIDCIIYGNIYLNHVTCISNIFKTVVTEPSEAPQYSFPENQFTYNPNFTNCTEFNLSPGNAGWANLYNWVDIFVEQPDNCLFQLDNIGFSSSQVIDFIPTISINNGNIVASMCKNIIIGHGDSPWLNSPIENDSMVNIIANRFTIILFDNPSFGFNIKNNEIRVGTFGIDSFIDGDNSTSVHNIISSVEFSNSLSDQVYLSAPYANYTGGGQYSHIFIFSGNSSLVSSIINNDITVSNQYNSKFIGIDNLGFNHSNLNIFNNKIDEIYGTSEGWTSGSNPWPLYQSNPYDDGCTSSNMYNDLFLFRNYNQEYNGKFWYNYGGFDQDSNYYCGFSFLYNRSNSNLQNSGNPSFEYTDLDLTRNDIGKDGGSYPWDMFHSSSNGKGRIFWLNIPHILSDPTNFQIKAKGAHLK
tara:strand:- start:2350 stop:3954 length:1605 start_codon:yes stop_codon:yes gene_type:complete